jgi:hypothetical protein
MTGGREPLSRPSSRHGEARHPLTLTFARSLPMWRERPARSHKQKTALWKEAGVTNLLMQAESRGLSAFDACV